MKHLILKQNALTFIVLLGLVSLFADITYEGARSITGAYLAVLGANAAIVGFVAGFGEFIGYGLRYASGILADKTQRYWLITFIGYAINVLSVPLLAFTNSWEVAAFLIVLERFGKSLRVPARDAFLAHASDSVGMGWGFGLHEALDQMGAMLGPIIVAVTLFFRQDYKNAFMLLMIPAVLALLTLYLAYRRFPNPQHLKIDALKINRQISYPSFKLFLIASAIVAVGYSDFPLMAYHFEKIHVLTPLWIPISYGIAMGVDGLAAPLLGKLYDRYGLIVLILTQLTALCFAPFVFLGNFIQAIFGVILWGIGLGVQESLFRSIVGEMAPKDKRASFYGLFNMVYGISWFLGSLFQGVLYDHSILFVVAFIMIFQFLSILFFIKLNRKWQH